MPDYPLSEEIVPNIQPKPPLSQPEAVSSCPIPCSLGAEPSHLLAPFSFQAVVESDKVPPEPSLLQTKPPQVPQPFPITFVLQALHQLHCPSLVPFSTSMSLLQQEAQN